ncbi:hypothetical protein BJP25_05500 [Actinokineospora bangkokensis]|uniref:NYN domain-containing protein n=2 Tax=Actinokineospora bangkokensis TaxID=1193682 RepID=A0A1Q9LBY9_9PSEU|nr:hypothetical protein BJP25_05500 [Actinokineospora bangkokensis]
MGKNSADIHMVLDILDTLTHPVYYDEFIVLSADADFTPVLQRLREHDRRSAILTANPAAAAMHAACDFAIPDVIFLDEALGLGEPEAEPEAATIKQPDHDSPDDALHTKIQSIVRDLVAESKSPIAMAKAAHEVRKVAGSAVDTTAWAGSGSFGKFVAGIVDEHLQVAIGRSPGWLFDPTRHTPPEVEASAVDVPEVARRINHVVRAPLLPTSAYTCLFDVLAGDARSMAGSGQVAVERAARDICAERGETVSRQAVHFVLVNYSYNGISWTTPEWDANVLASQFADSMLKLAADAQMALTDDEQAEVRQWIQGGQGGAQI